MHAVPLPLISSHNNPLRSTELRRSMTGPKSQQQHPVAEALFSQLKNKSRLLERLARMHQRQPVWKDVFKSTIPVTTGLAGLDEASARDSSVFAGFLWQAEARQPPKWLMTDDVSPSGKTPFSRHAAPSVPRRRTRAGHVRVPFVKEPPARLPLAPRAHPEAPRRPPGCPSRLLRRS